MHHAEPDSAASALCDGNGCARFEAFGKLDELMSDVVLTDLKMPGLNGIRFMEGTSERVAGDQTLKVDVRGIAATNRDLEAQIKNRAMDAHKVQCKLQDAGGHA